MAAVLTVVLIALMVAVWVTVIWVIPSAANGRLRMTLWEFRDELFDEIYSGGFEDPSVAKELLSDVERAIVVGHKILSPAKLLWWAVACRIGGLTPSFSAVRNLALELAEAERKKVAALSSADRERMEERLNRYQSILARHFLLSTYSGWFAILFVVPVVFLVAIRRGWKQGAFRAAKTEVRDDLALDYALLVIARQDNTTHPELSAFV